MLHECLKVQVDYKKVGAIQDGYQPLLYTYVLDRSEDIPQQKKRPAVIICPGGGYTFKSDREAEPIAMRYLAAGIHAFVLQYSVAPSRYPSAALELAASVKMVRENAESWGIIPDRIFIAGFSAGGHLCATLGTLWDEPVFEQAFDFQKGKDKVWRPDGMILCYPVITFGEYGHRGSRDNLLGPDASKEQIQELSLETRVGSGTVPAFLWHTHEDNAVPVENSLYFAMALRKAKVPFEMHIYEKGCHGLSLCDETTAQNEGHLLPDDANWIQMAIRWVKREGR
jgi:acetyl esterase/lipase